MPSARTFPLHRALASVATTLAFALVSTSSAADEAPVGRAAIASDMIEYYRGERDTAVLFMGIGTASVAAGSALVAERSDFARGLGWSLIGVGAFEVLGSAFYALEVSREMKHYSSLLAKDPAAFKSEEAAHIHGTTSRFFWYRTGELVLAALGASAAVYGFVSDRDVWKGAGIGIAGEALTFFVLDAFGQRSAHDYEERVRRFEPTLGFNVGGGQRPWSLDVGARF